MEASATQTRGARHQLFIWRVARHSLVLASRLYEQVRYREHGQNFVQCLFTLPSKLKPKA